jgi:hypothetical protein
MVPDRRKIQSLSCCSGRTDANGAFLFLSQQLLQLMTAADLATSPQTLRSAPTEKKSARGCTTF